LRAAGRVEKKVFEAGGGPLLRIKKGWAHAVFMTGAGQRDQKKRKVGPTVRGDRQSRLR